MPWGGKRPGAGRKKGAETKRTKARREIAAQAAAEGITPLEVMLNAMREYAAEGEREKAIAVAALAAPYVHPRLAAAIIKNDRPTAINIAVVSIDGKPDALQTTEVVPVESVPVSSEMVDGGSIEREGERTQQPTADVVPYRRNGFLP